MFIIAYNGHPVTLRTIPLMLYTQWLGSFVKIKALFNLADQKWSKGTDIQSSDDSLAKVNHPLFDYMPDFLMTFSYALFIYVMFLSHGAIALPDLDVLKTTKLKAIKDFRIYGKNFGVIANDGRDDAPAINKMIRNAQKNSIIMLPRGVIDLYTPIYIRRSDITLKGYSKEETVIVSHLHTEDKAAIYVKGKKLKRIGTIWRSVKYKDSVIYAKLKTNNIPKWIKIREPNDTKFFNELGSVVWRRKYPYLRQEITSISSVHKNLIYLNNALSTRFSTKKSEIYALNMIENIHLENFTMKQVIEGHNIYETMGKYQNLFPSYRVDLIQYEFVANSSVSNIKLLDAGSHPLSFENVYGCTASYLEVDGSWNKGKKGNGYIKFSRTFNSKIEYSKVKNIRHLTIQWSSANNRFLKFHSSISGKGLL